MVVGPGSAAGARARGRSGAAGIKVFGPAAAAAQLEGSKGFTKDLCRDNGIPTAAYERFRRAAGQGLCRARGAPIVVKADGLAAGKGVVVANARRSRGRHRHDVRRRLRRGRRRSRDRGVPRGRGGQVLRAVRRRHRAAAGHRAGPQARLRRRHGTEHRRHGRLFAGADDDAAMSGARHGRDRRPTLRAMAAWARPTRACSMPG